MPIISLSSLSYTNGLAIAQEACSQLGYRYIGPELYVEASEQSGIPPEVLERGLTEPVRPLGFALTMRKTSAAHVQAVLAAHCLKDDLLYQCPFGAHMIKGVSHLLKVRINTRLEDRVELKAQRDGSSPEVSRAAIEREDKTRRDLAQKLFGVDDDGEDVYDLVLDTSRIDMAEAVESITTAARNTRYSPVTYSVRHLEDQELGYRVRAALVDLDPDVDVQVASGDIRIRLKPRGWTKKKTLSLARERAAQMQGVERVTVEPVKDLIDRAADLG